MSVLVSVIMPVYNAEAFVADAVDSVLVQTYPHWELVVVDDGSTDASPEILGRYVDPRIIRIRQENQGEGGARNTGLDIAHGDYIGFLDADDLYLSNALADYVTFFRTHPEFGVVFSDGHFCDETKRLLMRFGDHRPGVFTGNILEPLVLSSSIISVPTMMMTRRSVVEQCNARFDTSLRYGVDWDFWTQLARSVQFGHLNCPTALYRVHGSNMTNAVTLSRRRADLLAGRLKIMRTEWFPELSVGTRHQFFYNLLMILLDDDPQQQREIIQTPQFLALPRHFRADLLRLVAGGHLGRRQSTEFAQQCLHESLVLQPENRKTRWLLGLADRSPAGAAAALSTWRAARTVYGRLCSLGRRPKPIPASLLPKSR